MEVADVHFELNSALLDEVVVSLTSAKGKTERRKSLRQRFPLKQLVAPFYRKMPQADQFVAISCHDLSTSGISFYWPAAPDFSKAIFGLGNGAHLTYLAANVVRTDACGPGDRVLVGCVFVDRVGIS